jgi:hypothetical protein
MKNEIKELLKDSKKFRAKLVANMKQLEDSNISCKNCTGVCCTVSRNSMQVTPVEALDLYFYLLENIKDKVELNNRIEQSITQYGLDREIYVKGRLLRKNYTCPLFKFESWGCPVDAELKPLGCLGYNALVSNVVDGENCASDVNLLEVVEKEIKEEFDQLNLKIKNILKIDFDKTNIPTALKYFSYLG